MCDSSRTHADIIALAMSAAELAYDTVQEEALDDHVIRSAIRQSILNLGDVPEGIFADTIEHTRAILKDRIKGVVQ